MNRQTSWATAVATIVALPLLVGCGADDVPRDRSATPASTVAPAGTRAPSAAVAPSTIPTSDADAARQAEQVAAATETFVRTVLTIGYPDRSFDAYLRRIQPLMTEEGFATLESAESTKKGPAALASLYGQRARSAPRFSEDAQVTSMDGPRATVRIAYENVAQRKDGDGWTTLESLGKGTVTVRLVRDDGRWLVEDAS